MIAPAVDWQRLLADDGPDEFGCRSDEHMHATLPEQASPFVVYGYYSPNGTCLYVGQTDDLVRRYYAHRSTYRALVVHATTVRILATADTRDAIRALERQQIRALDPVFNVHHSPSNRKSA